MTSDRTYDWLYSETLKRYEPKRKKWAWITGFIGGFVYVSIIVVAHWLSLKTIEFAVLTFLIPLIIVASLVISTFAESQSKERYIEDCVNDLQR